MHRATSRFLVIGYGNHAKSPIAEALLQHHAPHVVSTSGGIYPSPYLAPEVSLVLDEIGVTPPTHAPRKVDEQDLDAALEVICVTDAVPDDAYRRALTRWNVETPASGDLDAFRRVRDQLDDCVRALLERHQLLPRPSSGRASA